jgi:hypothetical protein
MNESPHEGARSDDHSAAIYLEAHVRLDPANPIVIRQNLDDVSLQQIEIFRAFKFGLRPKLICLFVALRPR